MQMNGSPSRRPSYVVHKINSPNSQHGKDGPINEHKSSSQVSQNSARE